MILKDKKFHDLPARIFSAVIFGFIAVGSLVLGGMTSTLFLSVCVAVLVWEVFYIFNNGHLILLDIRIIIPALIFFIPILKYYDFYPVTILFIIVIFSALFKEGRLLKCFCIFYVGMSVTICQMLLLNISSMPSFWHILLILAIVAASDIGGYFFGRIIGGPKIYISISPKKTWAGSLGGIGLSIMVCIAIKPFLEYSLVEMVGLGFFLSLAAQAGDFFESFLKRRFKVKDSGFLLPGHGGFFDRLDGVLAAVPIYFALLFFY